GYSISYVNDQIVDAMSYAYLPNAGLSSSVAATGLSGFVGNGLPNIQTPTFQVPRTLAQNYLLSSGAGVGMADPNLVTPYIQQWNIGIEHAIKNTVLSVRYVGNHGVKEIRGLDYDQIQINQLLPNFLIAQNNGWLAQKATGAFN